MVLQSPSNSSCDLKVEDLYVGCCLNQHSVKLIDTRDDLKRTRFLPLRISNLMQPNFLPDDHWVYNFSQYAPKKVCLNLSIIYLFQFSLV